jgi:2-dehydro-3-deoxygluconokinase
MNTGYDVICMGENCIDVIFKVEGRIDRGRNHLCSALNMLPGGTGVNFAIAASRLGLKTELVTTIGIDNFGEDIRAVLEREGVSVQRGARSARPTAMIFAVVDEDGEKTTMAFIHDTAYEDMSEVSMKEARAFYLSGGLLTSERCAQIGLDSMKSARKKGMKVFFDPQPRIGEHIEHFYEWAEGCIENSDVLFMTDWELKLLRGSDTERAMSDLLERLEVVCVKTGDEGCTVCSHGLVKKIPPFRVEAVSTLGCGDVFNAAFIRAYLSGSSAEAAGLFANRAAALNSMALGVINGAPYINEVDESEGDAESG